MKLLGAMILTAAAAFMLVAEAQARDMSYYKVPTPEQIKRFVDGSMRNIPYSEYEVSPGLPINWALTWNVRRMDEVQGQGDFKVVSLPWRIDVNLPNGVHFVHPAIVAKWLDGALGRAFDSKYCETEFFVYVHNADGDYEAELSPLLESDPGGPSWDVVVKETRYVD